jgi:predicted unusual protein kinase regulating ubiquinone biosynthesis (AarF/ABC1/UbiB family)
VLDFGSVSTVGHETVEGLIDVLQGYFEQQEALVFQGIERIGFAAPGADRDLLEQTVKTYFTRLLRIEDTTPQALMDASPDELQALVDPELERAELRRLMKSVQYPEGWFYVERASVLLFWLCAQIDPKLDTVQAGFPHVLPLLANRTESLS